MHIRIGFDLIFDIPARTPMLLMLYVHPSRQKDLLGGEKFMIYPNVPVTEFLDSFGNKVGRIVAPPGQLRITHDITIRDTGEQDFIAYGAEQHPVEELPTSCLLYLMGSRYCETDRLTEFAWSMFSNTQTGYPRVQAVLDWVHNHIKFGYAFARSTRSAYEAYNEKQGVCRDFTHLAIALLRALNIPARYVTGYLGDIGVPFDPNPMDFSAWLEVYLGGRWWTCDARHNRPRIGRILMATGRDATDVALTTSFGPTTLRQFHVVTKEIV